MKKDIFVIKKLIDRSLKIFCKDKASLFFSMLAPLIILVTYVLFLADVQVITLNEILIGMNVDAKIIQGFVDGWMLAGVIAVACLTVSFSAQIVMVQDRENGTLADMLIAPVKRGVLSSGYLVSNYVITVLICAVVVAIEFIYMAIAGWYMSAADVFGIIGNVLLSALSASLFSTIICKFFKTASAHGAGVGILSAAIGFVIGAYMPLSIFPKALQYIVLFIPGTYSAAIFRNLFMRGVLEEISLVSAEGAETLKNSYNMELNFFGKNIGVWEQVLILALTVALFAGIFVVIEILRNRKKALRKT